MDGREEDIGIEEWGVSRNRYEFVWPGRDPSWPGLKVGGTR